MFVVTLNDDGTEPITPEERSAAASKFLMSEMKLGLIFLLELRMKVQELRAFLCP